MNNRSATEKNLGNIKILILTTSYPLSDNSASGIFVKHLAERLAQSSEVVVLCPDDSSPDSKQKIVKTCSYAPKNLQNLAHQPGGIPVALKSNPLMYLLVPGLLLSLFFQTFKELKKKQLVLANWSISALVAAFPCWLMNKSLVTVLRGEDIRIRRQIIKRLLLKLALRISDKIVLVSNDMATDLINQYPQWQSKFEIIPNGVVQSLLDESIASEAIKNKNSNTELLSVGSLIPRKGMDRILKAIAHPDLKNQKLRLTIIGGGESGPELRETCKFLGLEHRVEFTNHLPPSKVYPYYATSQIFILASSHEGRPNVMVEAMAAGCCVVASKINGTKELINHNENGLLFSLESQDALANCILRLIQNPELTSRLGKNARQTIIDLKLNWQGTASAYVDLFKKIL